jgi:F-type H+-transporting ATPase subunit delta
MNTRAANRYAKALIELASQSNIEDVVQKDMANVFSTIQTSKELQDVLNSPIIKISDKKAVVEKIFDGKVNPLTNKLFALLSENKRMDLLHSISGQYNVLYNDKKGIVKAIVTSAVALDDELKAKVLTKAKELVGNKSINLETKIDESLVGGFILRVGDVQVDASIATQLNKLKRSLSI